MLTPGALADDPDGYRRLAREPCRARHVRYRRHAHGVPFAAVSAAADRLRGLGEYGRAAISLLHVVLGVATVGLVLVLGRWWGLGNRGAALAALLVACDPILLSQSAQVMTETLAAFLATAGLLALTWLGRQLHGRLWPATLAGVTLCRPGVRSARPAHLALGDRRRRRVVPIERGKLGTVTRK